MYFLVIFYIVNCYKKREMLRYVKRMRVICLLDIFLCFFFELVFFEKGYFIFVLLFMIVGFWVVLFLIDVLRLFLKGFSKC